MKSFVITILKNDKSVQVAQRCISSAAKYNINVEMFSALTPEDNPEKLFQQYHLPVVNFIKDSQRYSRYSNTLAAFLSHWSLWNKCIEFNENILILEHDAVFVDSLPSNIPFDKCISIGKPSYGKWITPQRLGVNSLTSKKYFPGAHGYILTPAGAKELIDEAELNAAPTDIFLSLQNFPWLQELYPWPVEAHDSFTTIQNPSGCYAKHNYNDKYEIL